MTLATLHEGVQDLARRDRRLAAILREFGPPPLFARPAGFATLVLINAGLLLRLVAEPWHAVRPSGVAAALLVGSAAAQWIAGLAFVWQMWPRVKER